MIDTARWNCGQTPRRRYASIRMRLMLPGKTIQITGLRSGCSAPITVRSSTPSANGWAWNRFGRSE